MILLAWSTGGSFAQPVITIQPHGLTNLAGTTASFSVTATSALPLAYQWIFDSVNPLANATNADLVLTNVQSLNAGGYSVVITNVEGSVTSAVAVLTILTPPMIVKQPINQTASLFADATFGVTVKGDAPFGYQWRFNDANLVGLTNTTLAVTNIQLTSAGNYNVVVTNFSGSVTSQVATLTITPFNSIYCFGWSFTDTSGHNSSGAPCTWYDNPLFYQNHACNGPMWPEFLSTNLGLVYAGANNYARCGANLLDIENQVINFPSPRKPQLSLYCLQAAGPDAPVAGLVNALTNEVAGNQLLQTTLLANSNSVNRLYTKGARSILIPLDYYMMVGGPFGVEPVFLSSFGTNRALDLKMIEYYARFNAAFVASMNAYSETRPDVRIQYVDNGSRIGNVLSDTVAYGFTVDTIDAIHDPALTDKSFTGPGADYVFWVGGHPTSKLHNLIAAWAQEALTNSILEKLEVTIVGGLLSLQMNHLQIGRDYTLEKSDDLRVWTDVLSFTADAGTNQWTSALGAAVAGYYRMKWEP
jgi:phospholipase/lecithinase/hemolysin